MYFNFHCEFRLFIFAQKWTQVNAKVGHLQPFYLSLSIIPSVSAGLGECRLDLIVPEHSSEVARLPGQEQGCVASSLGSRGRSTSGLLPPEFFLPPDFLQVIPPDRPSPSLSFTTEHPLVPG